ncbi:MAG TPA: 3-oxoacyl-ACP synthase [Candidatus Dormibacteraeota bacterium]|nr:3-oxoacyl-ACP synthase [Candidatus Dormibacteraeota bacterium]
MAGLAIAAAAWHIPERAIAVADLPELAALPEVERETCLGLGIEQVPADDRLDSVELAVLAAERALARAGLEAGRLDALVLIEPRAPAALMASEATRVQWRLGAARAVTFSVGGLGCASLSPALMAARGLLAANPDWTHVLVAHGSKPAAPCRRYRHPVSVSGDGGQALVLGRSGDMRVRDVLQETDGAYWDLFQVDYRRGPEERWAETCRDVPTYSFRLAMETRARLRDLVGRLLRRNGLDQSAVAGYVCQNLSEAGLRFTEEALGVELAGACLANLRRHGHLGPIDVLLNLYAALERGEVPRSAPVVAINVSPVAAWSVMLVEAGPPAAPADLEL